VGKPPVGDDVPSHPAGHAGAVEAQRPHGRHLPLQTNPLGRYSFTERARQVVVLAQDEARTLKHNYIGTKHILVGLVRENEGRSHPARL
jgi:hypothetical protein